MAIRRELRLNWKFPIHPVLVSLGMDPTTYRMTRGRSKILCPFHDESRPSAVVDWERQRFRCFACGVNGDAVDLLQEREGLSRAQARDRAEAIAGIGNVVVPESGGDRGGFSLFD